MTCPILPTLAPSISVQLRSGIKYLLHQHGLLFVWYLIGTTNASAILTAKACATFRAYVEVCDGPRVISQLLGHWPVLTLFLGPSMPLIIGGQKSSAIGLRSRLPVIACHLAPVLLLPRRHTLSQLGPTTLGFIQGPIELVRVRRLLGIVVHHIPIV